MLLLQWKAGAMMGEDLRGWPYQADWRVRRSIWSLP
jgi:hypothetical protein